MKYTPTRRCGRYRLESIMNHQIITLILSMSAVLAGCSRKATPPPAPTIAAAPATRILAMAPNAAEIICDLGAGEFLVGVSTFCKYPPELAQVPKIGGLRDPDLETILSLRPDLVVLRGHSVAVHELCQEHRIAVYDDRVETLEDLFRTIGDLGDRVGKPERARARVGQIRHELDEIAARVAHQPKVKVLFVVGRTPGTLANVIAAGRGNFLDELITIAGGTNMMADSLVRYPSVGLEEILTRRPDVIVESSPMDEPEADRLATLAAQWSALGSVPAVRDGRVHVLPEPYITIPSPRVVWTARKLVELFHPELAGSE